MFRDMDQQFSQDATVLRNAIKELKVRAGDIRPGSTGTFDHVFHLFRPFLGS